MTVDNALDKPITKIKPQKQTPTDKIDTDPEQAKLNQQPKYKKSILEEIKDVDFDTETISSNDHQFQVVKIGNQLDEQPLNVAASQENTRAGIAWTFTIVFLALVFSCIIGPFIINALFPGNIDNPLEVAKQLSTNIGSILGGPFGFIMGFYFKQKEDY